MKWCQWHDVEKPYFVIFCDLGTQFKGKVKIEGEKYIYIIPAKL